VAEARSKTGYEFREKYAVRASKRAKRIGRWRGEKQADFCRKLSGEKWKDILVMYNGNRKPVTVDIPEGDWNVVCHDGQINLSGIMKPKSTKFVLAPSSASIMYVD
jgi:pullulanase/glycogen debranching enzyme